MILDAREPILVITLSNVGDLVMTTPVLEALARRFPDSPIDVLGDRRSLALLAPAPYTRTLHARDKRAGWAAQWRLLRVLRAVRYGLVVDLRTAFLPYLLRARVRLIEAARGARGRHAVERHYALVAPLCAAAPPACRLYLDPAASAGAEAVLRALPPGRWLALAPGAKWPGKRWPPAHYRALLGLARNAFDGAIVLGSAAETEAAAALAGGGMPVVNTAGTTDLGTAAALIARASAFVGNDSGLGHVAAALSIPTLTLFGPGDPARYRPWGPRTDVLLAPGGELAALAPTTVQAALARLVADAH
jgi:ADP-heptose:LPS heptosyltransferase